MIELGNYKKGENVIPEEQKFSELLKEYILNNRIIFIKILLSLFILLDIISIIISATYLFYEIFIYSGIMMILIAGNVIFYVILERNLLWSIIGGVILGLVPLIEIIYHISTVVLDIGSIITSVFGLCFSLAVMIAPTVFVIRLNNKNTLSTYSKK
ncbi:MAG: hypothetical protein ACFFDW_16885 [Candidatus Thorarchaeota archaeon]